MKGSRGKRSEAADRAGVGLKRQNCIIWVFSYINLIYYKILNNKFHVYITVKDFNNIHSKARLPSYSSTKTISYDQTMGKTFNNRPRICKKTKAPTIYYFVVSTICPHKIYSTICQIYFVFKFNCLGFLFTIYQRTSKFVLFQKKGSQDYYHILLTEKHHILLSWTV